MAAPTYFGSACNQSDNATGSADNSTVAVTPPASMVAGDLVFMIGQIQVADQTAITLSATGGQSWRQSTVSGASFAGNDMAFRLWFCEYNGTWSTDPSLAYSSQSGTQPVTTYLIVFRPDVVGAWFIDLELAPVGESSQDPMVLTDATPTKRDNVTLCGIFLNSALTVASLSGSGWTLETIGGANQIRNLAGSDQTASFGYRLQSTPAATADPSFDLSGSGVGGSFTICLYNSLTPTISPNTADATDFGSDSTPTIEFTGTDGNADDVRYNFQIDSVSTFDSGGSVVDDSYSETNQNATAALNNITKGWSQSFTATGGNLKSAKFYLSKSASPTGNATAKLYNHSGTYGTSSKPTGAALATSDNFDVSTLTGSLQLITFTFSGTTPPFLVPSQTYVITIEYSGGSATNIVNVGYDSTPAHGGNEANQDLGTGNWSTGGAGDLIFYVYTADPLLSKVSGTDSGFANTVTGGDTDPFNSGEKVGFTVQAGDALADGTYYWRARASDPNGSATYSSWTTARSFTIASVPPPSPGKKLFAALLAKRHFDMVP
jgi:hypothetical protein